LHLYETEPYLLYEGFVRVDLDTYRTLDDNYVSKLRMITSFLLGSVWVSVGLVTFVLHPPSKSPRVLLLAFVQLLVLLHGLYCAFEARRGNFIDVSNKTFHYFIFLLLTRLSARPETNLIFAVESCFSFASSSLSRNAVSLPYVGCDGSTVLIFEYWARI